MLLFDNPDSGNCYKVRLLLAQLGIAYEKRVLSVVDRSDRAEVLGALNPGLRVPTLLLDDGRPLAESNAILWYFADGTDYLPAEAFDRAKVLQWLFFEQYSHEPNIAVLRFWNHFATTTPSDADIAAKREGGSKALFAMEAHLADHDYFVAGAYSIADIALYAYTHAAADAGFDLAGHPAVTAWLERVRTQPGHVAIDA